MAVIPMKEAGYLDDQFARFLSGMFPFFVLLVYIVPVYRMISRIVEEKERKSRESMRMMGLTDFSYWCSWFTYYIIVVIIISILCTIIVSINVIRYTNRFIIFLYFFVYGSSLFGLIIFLQSFFYTARSAAITGTLFYFASSFISSAVSDKDVSSS